ncbi:hypothetical protein HCC61_23145 [Streptomyces sp. HNM0575]|uniref:hypothetical protein n=1 Tax=Streptomyces sp. HNM0575 TaxID=2716338 RepID=UPI00145F8059|nr:hypothetical protein [Streptomyces sp. HNM0575]NLU75525.1 hypothetical protein [Streptomyces sp. HNM0575]
MPTNEPVHSIPRSAKLGLIKDLRDLTPIDLLYRWCASLAGCLALFCLMTDAHSPLVLAHDVAQWLGAPANWAEAAQHWIAQRREDLGKVAAFTVLVGTLTCALQEEVLGESRAASTAVLGFALAMEAKYLAMALMYFAFAAVVALLIRHKGWRKALKRGSLSIMIAFLVGPLAGLWPLGRPKRAATDQQQA